MRYSASEKYEFIRLVESSSLSVRQTLRHLDIHRSTFYNWLHRFQDNGIDGLEDRKPTPTVAWNQIPQDHRDAIIELAVDKPELSPRELAVRYTDQQAYFVSEFTVYRLLKAQDLITSPAYILMQAGDTFQHPSKRVNELWQTDLPISRSLGGVGITCRRYSMITRDLSSPGDCAPAWAPVMSLTRSMTH